MNWLDRRTFLTLAVAGVLTPFGSGAIRQAQRARRRLLQLNGYAINAETPLDLLTDYLTPNEVFFVRHHWQPSIPDPVRWRLVVDGQVEHALALSLTELKRMPVANATCVLQCAGNGRGLHNPPVPGMQWERGAVGNARWTGVRVKDLLERAGLRASVRHLHTSGSDTPPGRVPAFHRSLEIEKALQDGIVAYAMNGAPLPPLHGGPARLVVPGWAGDHWMKWLVRLSAQSEPQRGFYMDVAYRYPNNPGAPGVSFRPDEMTPVTELAVKSNFTGAPAQVRQGASVVLRGFAFSGAPDIGRVEVSDNDGESWRDAVLDSRHDPYAWRRWTLRWTPGRTGRFRLRVRATDSRGSIQPRDPVWNQSGYLYNGWDTVEIEVGETVAPEASGRPSGELPELGAATPALPDDAGRELAERACLPCHSSDVLRQQRMNERQWTASLAKMKGWGAELPESEAGRLIAYLTEQFGPGNDRFRPIATRPKRR